MALSFCTFASRATNVVAVFKLVRKTSAESFSDIIAQAGTIKMIPPLMQIEAI